MQNIAKNLKPMKTFRTCIIIISKQHSHESQIKDWTKYESRESLQLKIEHHNQFLLFKYFPNIEVLWASFHSIVEIRIPLKFPFSIDDNYYI